MHESLKVYLKDSFVGWLSHETSGDEYSFSYDESYLANPVDGALRRSTRPTEARASQTAWM